MTYACRGIVEGFYGRPWLHAERLDMFAFMAQQDLNGYIYAPKDDELHRSDWRAPYAAENLARFQELYAAATAHGIRFTFAMSPGLTVRYADPAEIEAVSDKLRPLFDFGLDSIGIFFDDVPVTLQHEADRARY